MPLVAGLILRVPRPFPVQAQGSPSAHHQNNSILGLPRPASPLPSLSSFLPAWPVQHRIHAPPTRAHAPPSGGPAQRGLHPPPIPPGARPRTPSAPASPRSTLGFGAPLFGTDYIRRAVRALGTRVSNFGWCVSKEEKKKKNPDSDPRKPTTGEGPPSVAEVRCAVRGPEILRTAVTSGPSPGQV